MTESRLRNIRQKAAKLSPVTSPRIAPDSPAVWRKLDGMWWGANPEDGVFRKDQFLQPSIGFTMTFPSGWKHRNTPQFVMAADPEQEALLLLQVAPGAADPEAAGEKFVARMKSNAGLTPSSAHIMPFGEFSGYVVT